MDSPSLNTETAERNTIVNAVMPFLDPIVATVLRETSSGYGASVQASLATNLVNKRRVEAKVGELPNTPRDHNWKRTYTLLTTEPIALLYTNNDVDKLVAQKYSVEKRSTNPQIIDSLHKVLDNAASQGYTKAFRIILYHLWNLDKLRDHDYLEYIKRGLGGSHLGILESPKLVEWMGRSTPNDIAENLNIISDYDVSPRVVDFYLAHIHVETLHGDDVGPAVEGAIRKGKIGMLTIFLKHQIFDPVNNYDGEHCVYDERTGESEFWNPIELAAKHGELDIVALFLADPRVRTINALPVDLLTNVIEYGHIAMVKLLLGTGKIQPKSVDVYTASKYGRVEILRLLLAYPDFHIIPDSRALQSAVNNNRTEIVLMLLEDPRITIAPEQKAELLTTAKFNNNAIIERTLRLHG